MYREPGELWFLEGGLRLEGSSTLLQFRAVRSGWFLTPVLMNDSVLVDLKSSSSGAAEYSGIRIHRVSAWGLGQGKQVPVLFATQGWLESEQPPASPVRR